MGRSPAAERPTENEFPSSQSTRLQTTPGLTIPCAAPPLRRKPRSLFLLSPFLQFLQRQNRLGVVLLISLVVRLNLHGRVKFLRGCLDIAQLLEGIAEAIMGLGFARVVADCFQVLHAGALPVFEQEERDAELLVQVGVLGV